MVVLDHAPVAVQLLQVQMTMNMGSEQKQKSA